MNALYNCTVDEVKLIDPTTVVFRIDFSRHVHLRDPEVVRQAMSEFVAAYWTRLFGWKMEHAGDNLFLFVSGMINPEILSHFAD